MSTIPAAPVDSHGGSEKMHAHVFLSGEAIVGYLAAAKFLLHMATAKVYGPFIDELYFLACGQHLSWGYVDLPPLTALQACLTRAFFGDSIYSIRLLPSLAGAGLVLLTGSLVRALGGKRFAQGIAALAVLVAPAYLGFDSYLSMNSIEPLLWMGCALTVIRIIQTGNTRLWLWFGLLSGIGMLNKHTMLIFGFAMVAGLMLTAERRLMWNGWFVCAGGIAALIFLPNLLWMIQHHFPHLELLANIKRNGRDIQLAPLQFLFMQALMMLPASLPLWLLGLWCFLSGRPVRQMRALGWAYLIALATLMVMQGKVYYLMSIYPLFFAGGAVVIEDWLTRPRLTWIRPAYAVLLGGLGALMAPTILPLLPADTYFQYTQKLGISQPKIENRATNAMPQFFADRFGWPEMVETVSKVYFALPPEERSKTAIIGNDYGQSGAVDFYGPKYGLPKSLGTHLSYWLWGPRDYTGEIMIVLGDSSKGASHWFDSVEEVASVGHPYAMKQEHFKVLLCRHPKGGAKLGDLWRLIKNYN